ncbi:MAG: fructose-bisphosphate aldolase [Candidatus Nephrothrix sp. EaCA]|nr:MAG: fructose-bisphosphate aldolase [Candidatus Nephrothrix sp. EaCA]
MSAVSPLALYKNCYGKYAIAAVNVFTMEQVHGLFSAAEAAASPVIVQFTPVARNYAHPQMLRAMIKAAAAIYPKTVFAVHLDHGTEEHAFEAIDSGYDSVMIDASHDDFETNIKRTKAVSEKAHAKNIAVEAELGMLSGTEDDLHIDDVQARYTNPAQAKEFVERSACDSLAVAVGTSHGAYKFSGGKGLQFDVLEKIQRQLPDYPLVLHGSSSVNPKDIQAINETGGRLSENAAGVSDKELRQAIHLGICKVNIATDLRLLWTKVHRRFFHEQPEWFDPAIPGKEYMKLYKEFMIERFEVLQSKGKSGTIKQHQL